MVEYSKIYLGKHLYDLDYSIVEEFFKIERAESNKIEYKSYSEKGDFDKQLNNVIRSLAAFLNSDGGLLIWGAPSGIKVEESKEKIFKGSLCPLSLFVPKDFLINKVSDPITPLPNNIRVECLEKEGKYIYVFEIQKGYTAHQYNNGYNMRLDGQTKPAPHHYVEALIKQVRYPLIEGYIKFDSIKYERLSGEFKKTEKEYIVLQVTILIFNFSALENELDISFRLLSYQGKFEKTITKFHKFMTHQQYYHFDGYELRRRNFQKTLHFGDPIIYTDVIAFDLEDLHKNNYDARLLLFFGGQKSPLKTSSYLLNIPSTLPDDPESLVVEKRENELSYDQFFARGESKEEYLNKLLNRKK